MIDELLIPEAEVSELKLKKNVHRLGERKDGKERRIIARFTRYSDHECVRSIAMEKLKAKAQFTVYQYVSKAHSQNVRTKETETPSSTRL